MMSFIIDQKGEEVISERHQKDYRKDDDYHEGEQLPDEDSSPNTASFTDIDFDDI